jgi:hypothetical protein
MQSRITLCGIFLLILGCAQVFAQFVVREGTVEHLKVEPTSGNVGIGLGTATPQAKLDVAGNIRFRSLGSSLTNSVLTVDADGNLSVTQDQQGSGADGVVTGVNISNGNTKTITLSRSVGEDLTGTFTDLVNDADADPISERQRLVYDVGTGRLTITDGGHYTGNFVTLTDNVEDHQALDEVLLDGNNAQGREAVNFGRLGVGTSNPGASLEVIGSDQRTYPFSFPGGGNTANASIFSQDLTPAATDGMKLLNIQSNIPYMNRNAGSNAYRVGVASHLVSGSNYVLASSMTIQDTYRQESAGVVGKVFGSTSTWSDWDLVAGGLFETILPENEPNIYALVADGDTEFRGEQAAVVFRNKDGFSSGTTNFDGLIQFGASGDYNIGKNLGTNPDELQIAAGTGANRGNINLKAANILFNSSAWYPSDRRFKENIQSLEIDPQEILKLQSVRFNWKDPNKSANSQTGFIAQEVESILPELVYTNEGSGYKYVNYTGLIPYLFNIIQQQQKRIEELEARAF